MFLPSREHFWMSKILWLCMRQNTVGLIKRLPVPYLRNWHRVLLPIFFSKIYHLCTCNISAGGLNREVCFKQITFTLTLYWPKSDKHLSYLPISPINCILRSGRYDHQLKKLLIVKQILLFTLIGNLQNSIEKIHPDVRV